MDTNRIGNTSITSKDNKKLLRKSSSKYLAAIITGLIVLKRISQRFLIKDEANELNLFIG